MFRPFYFSRGGGDNRFVHDLASYNGQIVAADAIRLPALSAAALYGKGLFTTLPIYDGTKDDWWYEHWVRLSRDALKLGLDISSLDLGEIALWIDELVRENRVGDGRARVTFFDEGPTELWPAGLSAGTSVLITTGDRHPVPEYFRLTVSPFKINSASPLAGVKSCNYLEKIFAKNEARERGFDESIQFNERGEVVSAAMANVFWLKGDQLFTPSLATGCVPGTTRLMALEFTDCREVETGLAELQSADAIFLTSAGLGVVQVAELDGRVLDREEYTELTWMLVRFGEHKNTRNRSE
jgi:branched-chain amino acid aminotransferase